MNSDRQRGYFVGSVLSIFFCFIHASWAEDGVASNELLVRYRDPQNSINQAVAVSKKLSSQTPVEVRVVNESEGLVQLRFTTATQTQRAHQALLQSSEVLQVSPNFLYRPAIHLRAHPVSQNRSFNPLGAAFLSLAWRILPFPDPGSSHHFIPDVNLTPEFLDQGPDPLAARDWAWEAVHMPEGLPQAVQGSPVVVAVIDSGVDYNHEDLIGAMWRNPIDSHQVGYDFVHQHARPFDVVRFDMDGCLKDSKCKLGFNVGDYLSNPGHGTHCAGHVAAVANNGRGIRGMGSPAKTQVMALKFLRDAGELHAGYADDAAAIQSIDYAISHGAKVINTSWGTRLNRALAEESELKKAMIRAQQAGIIVVVAAGNDGIDQDSILNPNYPAAFNMDHMIVVAAHDRSNQLAQFSSFGQKSVHISAPGTRIFSTLVGNRYGDVMAAYQDPQGQFHEMDWEGTSMAAPMVAGAVALVWSIHPGENYHQIRDRILRSARKIPGHEGKTLTGGILDVASALEDYKLGD